MKGSGKRRAEDLVHRVIERDGLVLEMIDLPVSLPGFEHHITSWLLQDKDRDITFLVDPGPAVANPVLERILEERRIGRLDYVLLTHVHLDHAGGIGHLVKTWPQTRILVPWRGRKHLVDPSKLWQGSVKTLGEVAVTFGELLAVSEELFHPENVEIEGLEIHQTPGHASHHQSYIYRAAGDGIFLPGEAAGVILGRHMLSRWIRDKDKMDKVKPPVPDLEDVIYMAPASPPVFDLDIAIRSLSSLMDTQSTIMCYSHYGYTRYPGLAMSLHGEQLKLWRDVIRGVISVDPERSTEEKTEQSLKMLLEIDGFLSAISFFDSDIQEKERFFLRSAIRGFLGFLEK